MSRQLCFTAIVKNEAAVIRRCLRSVKPHISCWCISDTGSTDETQAIIREELAGIPGALREDRWVDFATNRNLALVEAQELARKHGAPYVLTIDADEELLVPEDANFSALDLDSYNGSFELVGDDHHWQRKLLLKSTVPWRYEGVLHEYPRCEGATSGHLVDLRVLSHHDSKRNQQGAKKKYSADAKVLERWLKKHPDDARSWFYLARSYAPAGDYAKAISAYRKRVALGPGSHAEEVFHSLFQMAAIKEMLGHHWHDVCRAYLDAVNERPWRAEPLHSLAVLHRQAGEYNIAEIYARRAAALPIPPDALFLQHSVYEWRAADELAGILAKLGRLDEARDVLERLVKRPQVPDSERPRLLENIDMIKAAA